MTSEALGVSPGRVNLIGEHTDYNDGFVLPIALDKVARVTATPGEGDLVTISSEQLGQTVTLDTLQPGEPAWWGYIAGVLWSLRESGHDIGGVELALSSDVPLGGGLSSSAAIESATALALDAFADLGLSPDELADLVRMRMRDTFPN